MLFCHDPFHDSLHLDKSNLYLRVILFKGDGYVSSFLGVIAYP